MKKTLIIFLIIAAIASAVFWIKNRQANKSSKIAPTLNGQENKKNVQSKEFENNGLKIEILREGNGEKIKSGDDVSVNYTGWLENGVKFDSSLDRGVPFNFKVGAGQVIKGWDIGILGMKAGERRRLTIPPNLAYGEKGIPGVIPSKATLIFEVELLSINKPDK